MLIPSHFSPLCNVVHIKVSQQANQKLLHAAPSMYIRLGMNDPQKACLFNEYASRMHPGIGNTYVSLLGLEILQRAVYKGEISCSGLSG